MPASVKKMITYNDDIQVLLNIDLCRIFLMKDYLIQVNNLVEVISGMSAKRVVQAVEYYYEEVDGHLSYSGLKLFLFFCFVFSV